MATSLETRGAVEVAQGELLRAVSQIGLPSAVYEVLKEPQRLVSVTIPVQMSDGRFKAFQGFRAQHTDVLGPGVGGVRLEPGLTADKVKARAIHTTLQCAVLGLPCGGAAGGVICDPALLSQQELEDLARGYLRAIAPLSGPEIDVPAYGSATGDQISGYVFDEYCRLHGKNSPGVATGKPRVLGGVGDRIEATGLGCAVVVREAMRRGGRELAGARIAVQGFGRAAAGTAVLLASLGCRIVAASDGTSAWHDDEGLDVSALRRGGSFAGLGRPQGALEITAAELERLEVDVLVSAAPWRGLSPTGVRAGIVVELARGSVNPRAATLLAEAGTLVVPHILATAGAPVLAYLEWAQSRVNFYWPSDEVHEKLERMMVSSFEEIWTLRGEFALPLRDAAYAVAVRRLASALAARGWIS